LQAFILTIRFHRTKNSYSAEFDQAYTGGVVLIFENALQNPLKNRGKNSTLSQLLSLRLQSSRKISSRLASGLYFTIPPAIPKAFAQVSLSMKFSSKTALTGLTFNYHHGNCSRNSRTPSPKCGFFLSGGRLMIKLPLPCQVSFSIFTLAG
jgi:hypothetical protein